MKTTPSRARSGRPLRSFASAGLLGCAAFSPLVGATLSFQTSAPALGAHDIANLVGATRDRHNIGGNGTTDGGGNDGSTYISGADRPHQGQTFTTGALPSGYRLRAVWLRHATYTGASVSTWWRTPVGSSFTVRVTSPAAAGTPAFALASESLLITGSETGAPNAFAPLAAAANTAAGTGVWLRFGLGAALTLSPNTQYGFDVAATSGDLFFETHGLRDAAAAGGDAYVGGTAYRGSTNGAPDTSLQALAGDRVFVVELEPAADLSPHAAPHTAAQPFPLERVRLLTSRFKSNQDLHRTGYLAWLDPDRLLWPFRAEAGLPQPSGSTHLGGWEGDSGFTAVRGHMAGHYLTAAAKMYAATGDAAFLPKIGYLVAELKKCQDALGAREIAAGRVSGYLSAFPVSFFDTLETNPTAAPVPFYTIHKILAGLVDAYRHCGNEQALDVAIAMADYHRWRVNRLTAAQIEAMFRTDGGNSEEWGGMNETLADLYRFSLARGDADPRRHLDFARVFHRDWFIGPLVNGQDQLAGLHANTHVPQAVGFAHVASFLHDEDPERARLYAAASSFWNLVTSRHWLALGGNSYSEHFAAGGVETGLGGSALGVATAETCNTYNMLKLSAELFAHEPSAALADYHEHALYNHILASLAPDTGMTTYFVPMVSGHFKTYSQPAGSSWCCTGTGIENTARYGEGIYFHDDDTLWVNLFIPSSLDWSERGLSVRLDTAFPESDQVQLTLDCAAPVSAKLRLRIPHWIASAPSIAVNGAPQSIPAGAAGSYVELDRTWNDGDLVTLKLPMGLRLDRSMDDPTQVSLFHGPVLLAGELGSAGMPPSDQAIGQLDYQNTPRATAPALVAPAADELASWVRPAGSPLTYFATSAQSGATTRSEVLLRPFYDVHHTRYATYWSLIAPSSVSTWTGAGSSTSWTTAANWDSAPADGALLRFSASAGGAPLNNLVADTRLTGIEFPAAAGAFTLVGNRIRLQGDVANDSAHVQRIDLALDLLGGLPWTFDAASAGLVLGGPLGGVGTLTKTGPHPLTLLADSALSGSLHIAEGAFQIGAGGSSGSLGRAPVSVDSGASFVLDRSNSSDLAAPISGAGDLVKRGSGTLRLFSPIAHRGATVIEAGTLQIGSAALPVLAHRWSFNGDLSDSAGFSPAQLVEVGANDATLTASELVLAGGAQAASDYVSLGSGLLPKDGTPVTLEFWATQTSLQNWGRIFDVGSSFGENLFMAWSQQSLGTDRVEWKDASSVTANNTYAPLALGVEQHIVFVIEPGAGSDGRTRVSWYVAPASSASLGAARGTFETANTLAELADVNFWLGRSHYADPTASARYNEARLWTRVFSTTELEQLHDLGPDSIGAFGSVVVSGALSPESALRLRTGATLDLAGSVQTVASLSAEPGSTVQLGSGGRLVVRGGANAANDAVFAGAFTGSGELRNEGVLRLVGDAALPPSVTLANHGVLDTMSWSGATAASGAISGPGTVLDRSAVKVDSFAPAAEPGRMELRLHGHRGHVYQLQYREDLATGAWTNIGAPVSGADAPLVFSHAAASAPRRFYRVVVGP